MSSSIFFCFLGLTASGKGTVCKDLIDTFAFLELSISATSRAIRSGELAGTDYYFYSESEFKKLIESDALFEWEQTHGDYYGTLQKTIDQAVTSGKDLLFDVDIRGALNIRRRFPQQTVITFLLPPDVPEMIARMKKRSQIEPQKIKRRLETSLFELEMLKKHLADIDYLIVNSVIEDTLKQTRAIVLSERARPDRYYNANMEQVLKLEMQLSEELKGL